MHLSEANRGILAASPLAAQIAAPGRASIPAMVYRDDLAALTAHHDALANEVAAKTRELEATRQLLDEVHARARLPVLDNIQVAAPCTADWSQMSGDDRVRHCGACKKNVYNLSGMTRDEAEALLVERNGDLCVRYFQRHDGTILLADCTIGIARRRRRRWIAVAGATLLAGGVGAAAVLRANAVMGGIRAPSLEAGATTVSPPPAVAGTHVMMGVMGHRSPSAPEPSSVPVRADEPPR